MLLYIFLILLFYCFAGVFSCMSSAAFWHNKQIINNDNIITIIIIKKRIKELKKCFNVVIRKICFFLL